ncbi:hypothetical protein JCM33374_g1644 [Metschnikowia sp. JCM 33374]|nr:hypothetical protein JCM33374_g1644 [Metschnikowia sp. JCM 33374]
MFSVFQPSPLLGSVPYTTTETTTGTTVERPLLWMFSEFQTITTTWTGSYTTTETTTGTDGGKTVVVMFSVFQPSPLFGSVHLLSKPRSVLMVERCRCGCSIRTNRYYHSDWLIHDY